MSRNMNYSGNRHKVLASAEVFKPPNIHTNPAVDNIKYQHNRVECICYFELTNVYVNIKNFVKVTGIMSNALAT